MYKFKPLYKLITLVQVCHKVNEIKSNPVVNK